MSQNTTLRKSDKKFIRLEKARIRRMFWDEKKQKELISELYQRFMPKTKAKVKEVISSAEAKVMKEVKPVIPVTAKKEKKAAKK